jgi:hypothetical protein
MAKVTQALPECIDLRLWWRPKSQNAYPWNLLRRLLRFTGNDGYKQQCTSEQIAD